jgi:hypothetical protein
MLPRLFAFVLTLYIVTTYYGDALGAAPGDPAPEAEKYTISGYIKDAANGEDLIGAVLYIEEISTGAQANVYGFYSITLPPGIYHLDYRYLGYKSVKKEVDLQKDIRIDIDLQSENIKLEEVVIEATPEDQNVKSVEMGVNELDIQTIQKVPVLLGEVDVIKTLQLLPGVSSVGEGASGFNVRGGNVGQNLVLLDEAPVYNSSHLLGFFSVFNPDAVKDVKLYKGGAPVRYGGRLASLLDIRMKEGNNRKFGVQGGIGTIFSRLAVEGPIVKEKGSFIIAGRRSYIDALAKPFTDVLDDGAQLYFYDLTAKANYILNDNNRLYLSGYLGRDKFNFAENQGFSWGNTTGTLRWNHLFNDRVFSNFSLVYSDYDYSLAFGEDEIDFFRWKSRIRTLTFKPEINYFISTNTDLQFGGEMHYYRFTPANATGASAGVVQDVSLDKKYAFEYAGYVGAEQRFGESLSLQYGLRASAFNYMGPGNLYFYDNDDPGQRKEVIGVDTAERGESIASYFNLEPRFSMKIQTGPNSSVKASYNRMAQYLHLISNTTASNPLDVWTPTTNNIRPQTGNQYAVGYFKNLGPSNDFELSVEAYFRDTQNQIDYIDGADLLINEFLEGDLLSGRGRAYGLEFLVKKNAGRFTGWASYTLSRTELKVDGINSGNWYPTRFDQMHNLNLTGNYQINERWSLSANFAYISGTPTTFPTSRYAIGDYLVPYNAENSRNNVRIPSYHRLDLSATLLGKKFKKNGERRKNQDSLVFGIYNVYSRRNPFSIYFRQDTDRPAPGTPLATEAIRVSIVGNFVPAISYNFKF